MVQPIRRPLDREHSALPCLEVKFRATDALTCRWTCFHRSDAGLDIYNDIYID